MKKKKSAAESLGFLSWYATNVSLLCKLGISQSVDFYDLLFVFKE